MKDKNKMRTSTKQVWFMLINTVIDTHIICLALFYSVKTGNIAIWISASVVITALWAFNTVMFNNNNNRKMQENLNMPKEG
jgi:hypothetical protein